MHPLEPRVARPWCRDQRIFVLRSVVTCEAAAAVLSLCLENSIPNSANLFVASRTEKKEQIQTCLTSRCLLQLKTALGNSTCLSLSEGLSLKWMKSSNSVLSVSLSAWSAMSSQSAPMSLLPIFQGAFGPDTLCAVGLDHSQGRCETTGHHILVRPI